MVMMMIKILLLVGKRMARKAKTHQRVITEKQARSEEFIGELADNDDNDVNVSGECTISRIEEKAICE
eukprot:2012584-Ditylum_brightwellii.AAC.1